MATSILEYANREKVAQALTERGYSVTRNTVNRWARGDEMPAIAARMIAELFGHDTKNAPPAEADGAAPHYIERLLAGMISLENRADLSEDERDRARIQAATWLALSGSQARRRGSGGGAKGEGGA